MSFSSVNCKTENCGIYQMYIYMCCTILYSVHWEINGMSGTFRDSLTKRGLNYTKIF